MMDEQSKFKEALASVTIRAEENGGKLSAEEAKELLKDMADRLKVSSAFLSAVETGKKRPPANFIDQICSAYELSEDEKKELQLAADMSLDEIKIDLTDSSSMQRQAAVSFAKVLNDLTDDEISKIMRVFSKQHKK